jgi:hypothetical protein
MKKIIFIGLLIVFSLPFNFKSFAQPPQNRDFGFGLILGDPTGGTIKYWTSRENAIDAYIGGSYFGSVRIGADYLWHFNAFNSSVVNLYAGPGITLGFGSGSYFLYKKDKGKFYNRDEGGTGIGIRGVIGINIIPKKTPIEIFVELGPMIGIIPDFGTALDAAIGIRFYP